jgi:mRNA interferase MazF
MDPGEIFLAKFPFGDAPGMKLRPVLLLTGPKGPIPEVVVAYISSVIPAQPLPTDLFLDPARPEHRSTHLKTSSVVRLHKLASIHVSILARYLGAIDASTRSAVADKLRDLLNL